VSVIIIVHLILHFSLCICTVDRGAKIRNKRMELGLSQAELARRIGKTRGYINTIEKTGKVSDITYLQLINQVGITPSEDAEGEKIISQISKLVMEPSKIDVAEQTRFLMNQVKHLQMEIDSKKEIIELQKTLIEFLQNQLKKL
jgi:transcriptional regulator with XRE-family HTH domain